MEALIPFKKNLFVYPNVDVKKFQRRSNLFILVTTRVESLFKFFIKTW